jgi:3-methyladenine DNA glycosylase Tag
MESEEEIETVRNKRKDIYKSCFENFETFDLMPSKMIRLMKNAIVIKNKKKEE